MSRSVPPALQAYMVGHGLHMCKIVKVGPLPDGTYRGFADLDINLAYDDGSGSLTYVARTGVQMSALATSADLGVDNAEMDTLPPVSGFETEGFTTDQVRAGALDAVPYVVYCLNYEDTGMGHFVWAGGTLGEARIKNTALFNFEQRSISNQLKQIIGNVDSTTCRAKFGSMPIGTGGGVVEERQPCNYDTTAEWTAFTVTAAEPTDPDLIFYTGLTEADDYYRPGKVRMLTGANAGLEREVGGFANTAGTVTLSYAFPYDLAGGDTGEIRRDCTKHYTGHNSCETFWTTEKNLRFRGEPHIPVGDVAMSMIPGVAAPSPVGGTGEPIVTDPTYPEPTPTPTPSTGGGTYTTRTRGTTVVDPVTYGADPTGATDSTTAFNDAYAALPVGGGIVRPSAGTYKINPVTSIKPLSNTLLDLDTNNVTLQASYTALDHKYVIHVDQKTEVEIAGGTIIGYRDAWSPISGTTSEWGHGIFVEGGSAITIRDMTIHKCVGDGISLGKVSAPTAPDDVEIVNVLSTNNRRQAFTVGRSTNVLLRECEGSYTNGTAPKAGVDIEPDNPTTSNSSNTTIESCYFHHNDGPGIQCYRSADQVTITGTVLEYNSYGLLTVDSTTGTFTGNTIQHNRYNGAKFTSGTTGWTVGGASTLKNRFFNNNTSLRGTVTTGTTATISGTSSATSDHIKVESSTVSVVTNDFGPV